MLFDVILQYRRRGKQTGCRERTTHVGGDAAVTPHFIFVLHVTLRAELAPVSVTTKRPVGL